MAFTVFVTVALFSPIVLQSLFGTGLSPVLSDSMAPEFSAGDLLITGPTAAEQIAHGDVIVIRDDQSYISFAHRVVKREEVGRNLQLTTRGDANPTADEKPVIVEAGVALPKVILGVPYAGTPLIFFTTPTGRALSIGLLILAAILLLIQFSLSRRSQPREIALS